MRVLGDRGFTLVELMIYLGLSAIMLVILSQLFGTILEESVKVQNYSAVQTDGRYILGRLKTQLNNADSVSVPAGLGDSAGELIMIVGGTSYHYYVSNGHLYLNDSTGDYLISDLSTRVTDVVFTRTGNTGGKPVILIQFTSSTGVEGTPQYESQTFKGAGGLR